MIQDEVQALTGYGTAPYVMDPEYPTIKVDLRKRTVNGKPFTEILRRIAASAQAHPRRGRFFRALPVHQKTP